jgi:uncharacterized protein (TIGR02246 family)
MTELRQTIEAAAKAWMQAWVERDPKMLEESLAADFALVVSASPMRRLERAEWLQTACTRYVASTFTYHDIQVRELGPGFAVMSSIAEFTAEIDGAPRNGPLFLVDLWRRQEGRWRVCARYSSTPESKSASAVSALR